GRRVRGPLSRLHSGSTHTGDRGWLARHWGTTGCPVSGGCLNLPVHLLRKIRLFTALFIAGLFFSGVTAIPLRTEIGILSNWIGPSSGPVSDWLGAIRSALERTSTDFPFLFYGTDWLAFGHFIIALAFVGAFRDPARNRWLFTFGLLACAL